MLYQIISLLFVNLKEGDHPLHVHYMSFTNIENTILFNNLLSYEVEVSIEFKVDEKIQMQLFIY